MTKAVGFLQGSSGDQNKFFGIFIYYMTPEFLFNGLMEIQVKLKLLVENSRNSSQLDRFIILEDRYLI